MKFDMPKDKSSIIKVIGVGGGGSNAVNHMYRHGITGVDFIICNTDQQALDLSPIPNKMQLGTTLTEGRGAGSNPEVGKNAAIENVDDLKELLQNNTQMVFITAGMGGGTGTGAAPIIAKTAREMGILTVGIVTMPFSFEGKRRKNQADNGLEELRENVDTLLVIVNDKLREIYGNLKISEAFSKADDILTVAAKGIAEIITVAGYINVDFEDVKTVMKDGGTAIMGSASAEGEGRAKKAVSQALASPLLNDNDISGANYILLNITSGNEEVSMDEVEEITDYIQNESGYTADIIWGNGTDETLEDKICVTIIATGFGAKKKQDFEVSREPKKIVHNLSKAIETEDLEKPAAAEAKKEKENENENKNENEPYLKSSNNQSQVSFEFNLNREQRESEQADEDGFRQFNRKTEPQNRIPENLPPHRNPSEEPKRMLSEEQQLKNSQDRIMKLKKMHLRMNTPGGFDKMEREPAYKRRNISLDDTPHSSESEVSRYTLSEDENKKANLRQNNSFLHDNVD